VRRREFIAGFAGAAAWPLAAHAQQPGMPVVGFLSTESPGQFGHIVAAFRQGLSETGFVEHRNVGIEYRWAEGRYDRLPTLAAELAGQRIAAITATGGIVSGLAAKRATSTTPIVFVVGDDPVRFGLVDSLNRPSGNVTGVMILSTLLAAKRLELLRDLLPKAQVIGLLINPTGTTAVGQSNDLESAARTLGLDMLTTKASNEREIDTGFATLAQHHIDALVVATDPYYNSRREQIVALAASHAIPTNYAFREFAEAGGLMSYGTSRSNAYRQAGVYVGRILKGEKPADMPVLQPTTLELVINLKTAKALGITVPPTLIARADEVIE
jgi:putative ABC transport system substrate-binding protein